MVQLSNNTIEVVSEYDTLELHLGDIGMTYFIFSKEDCNILLEKMEKARYYHDNDSYSGIGIAIPINKPDIEVKYNGNIECFCIISIGRAYISITPIEWNNLCYALVEFKNKQPFSNSNPLHIKISE